MRIISLFKKSFYISFIVAMLAVTDNAGALTAAEIDAKSEAVLARFNSEVASGWALQERAKGILVIPGVTKAAFIVGGQYGEGILRENSGTTSYYSMTAGSVGLQAGAEKYDLILIFADEDALMKFRHGKGWEAGIDAEVTLVENALDLPASTLTSRHPILGFVLGQKGLLIGASIKGARFREIKPD